MQQLLDGGRRFWANEDGGAAIEYSLLGTLIAIGAYAAFTLLGDGLMHLFGTTADPNGAGGAITDAANSL